MRNKSLEKDIILGVCHQDNFIQSLIDSNVVGTDLDKPVFSWVLDNSLSYYIKYNKKPSKKVLKRLIERDSELEDSEAKKYLRTVSSLYKKVPDNPNFSLDELQKFSRKQRLISQLNNTAESIEGEKDIDQVIEALQSSIMKIEDSKKREWSYTDWLEGWEERQATRKHERDNPDQRKCLNFGIKMIDTKIKRGLLPGDFGSIAAKTGRGKSIFTIQVGLQGLFQQMGVTHITTENKKEQTTGRYDSRVTGIPYDLIQTYDYTGKSKRLLKQSERTIDLIRESVSTNLKVVKCIPNKTNIITIMSILDALEKKEGHKTDLLIIDSPELMVPLTTFKEYRMQKAAVYWEIKSLLLERDIIGFATSQLTRGSDDRMPTAEDMSEAYDKSRLLDLMFALVRTTKHMLTDEALLWIVKGRDFENDGQPILMHTDFASMFMDI